MSRLAPHQRKRPQISRASWNVVSGATPVMTNASEPRPITVLIFTWYRDWLRGVLHLDLRWRGQPLEPNFKWIASSGVLFNGRQVVDIAEELEGAALEGAAKGVETFREKADGAPLLGWVKQVMRNHLASEFTRWCETSSSTDHLRRAHRSLNWLLQLGEENPYFASPLASTDLSPETLLGLNDDEATPIDMELVHMAVAPLSSIEREALLLFVDGNSYSEIARTLGLSKHTNALRIVERARDKARKALS